MVNNSGMEEGGAEEREREREKKKTCSISFHTTSHEIFQHIRENKITYVLNSICISGFVSSILKCVTSTPVIYIKQHCDRLITLVKLFFPHT